MFFDVYQFDKFICTIPADSPEYRFTNLWNEMSSQDQRKHVRCDQWLKTLRLIPSIK